MIKKEDELSKKNFNIVISRSQKNPKYYLNLIRIKIKVRKYKWNKLFI